MYLSSLSLYLSLSLCFRANAKIVVVVFVVRFFKVAFLKSYNKGFVFFFFFFFFQNTLLLIEREREKEREGTRTKKIKTHPKP
tara:strand:- start:768 stop:1016 length:249 start_codon:yes stop_codon:yes gene_type:complete